MIISGATATEVWEQAYGILMSGVGYAHESRVGKVVGELTDVMLKVSNPRKNFVKSSIRDLSVEYAVGELMWYLSGSNHLDDIAPYASFWKNITDDGATLNSAYGHRIKNQFGFDQWEYAKKLLREDPFSRQALIHIKTPSDKPTKDTPCTIALQFYVRDEKLHLTVMMRSNDVWLGLPYDMFAFMNLQCLMAMELDYEVGDYTHFATSLHLYERNVPKDECEKSE